MASSCSEWNQSLDGYVDHMALPGPSPTLFRHFIEEAQGQAGSSTVATACMKSCVTGNRSS